MHDVDDPRKISTLINATTTDAGPGEYAQDATLTLGGTMAVFAKDPGINVVTDQPQDTEMHLPAGLSKADFSSPDWETPE